MSRFPLNDNRTNKTVSTNLSTKTPSYMTDQTFDTKQIYFTILFPTINRRTHIKQNAHFTSNNTDADKKSEHYSDKSDNRDDPSVSKQTRFSRIFHTYEHIFHFRIANWITTVGRTSISSRTIYDTFMTRLYGHKTKPYQR